MENENIEQQEAQTNPEGVSEPQAEGDEFTPEQIADLKKKADVSSQNFERLKKAEAELKELKEKTKVTPKEPDGLTNRDVLFLAKADIHQDDLEEVLEWAKFKKVPVSDAYKQLKTTLDVRSAERTTAEATNAGGGRSGQQRESSEQILDKAYKGEIPTDDAGIEKLAEARMSKKLAGQKK